MGLLSLRHPDAGGVAHFARLAFGPAAGAVVGWLFLLSVPVGVPVVAVTGAAYWTAAFGGGMAVRVGVAALLLLAVVLLNLRGMRLAANLQTVTVTLVVTLLLATVLSATGHVRPGSFRPFLPHGWVSVGQAAVTLFWCFIGGGRFASVGGVCGSRAVDDEGGLPQCRCGGHPLFSDRLGDRGHG